MSSDSGKPTAFGRARLQYGKECLAVQSQASYAIGEENGRLIEHRVEVRNRHPTRDDRGDV